MAGFETNGVELRQERGVHAASPDLLSGASFLHAALWLHRPVRRSERRAPLFSAIVLIALTGGLAGSRAAESEEPLRVVILHGANFFLPSTLIQEGALRETLVAGTKRRIEFYPEALETFRLPSVGYEPEYVALLQKKYSNI